MTIKIIDLYSDNTVNFDKLYLDGYSGVIFKAGQGELADVPRVHPDWWERAKDSGLDRGWFWVVDSRHSPQKQRDKILSTIPDDGELGFWLDCEKAVRKWTDDEYWATPYSGWATIFNLTAYLQSSKISHFNLDMPGFYTSPGFFKLLSDKPESPIPYSVVSYFANCLLWTAQYPWFYIPGVSKPTLYGLWTKWTFWQYREDPDINIFNGDIQDYNKITNRPLTFKGKIAIADMNVNINNRMFKK